MAYLHKILSYIPLFWLDVAAPCVAVVLAVITFFGCKKKYIFLFSLLFLCLFCGIWAIHPQGGAEYAFSGGGIFSGLLLLCNTLSEILSKTFRRAREKRAQKITSQTRVAPCEPKGINLTVNPEREGSRTEINDDLQLDHALFVLGKLGGKKLSVTDRLDANVIRNMINVYRYKETLSVEETRTLNRYLGTLLKLMSKYSV